MRSDKSDVIAVSSNITRIVSISNCATWIGSSCKAPQPARDCCCLALQQDPARCCCSWPWLLLALLLLRFQNRCLVGPKSWPTNTTQTHALLRTTKKALAHFSFLFIDRIFTFLLLRNSLRILTFPILQNNKVGAKQHLSHAGQTILDILDLFCTTGTETLVHWEAYRLHLGVSLFCLVGLQNHTANFAEWRKLR